MKRSFCLRFDLGKIIEDPKQSVGTYNNENVLARVKKVAMCESADGL